VRGLGMLTAALTTAVIAVVVVVAVRSAPDIQRYLKIRSM
jgi:hypothetical protein